MRWLNFSSAGISYMFSHTWLDLLVFRLALVTCHITRDLHYMFSQTWHWLHVLSHMTCITSFPKLDTGYMSVPHVTSITCFPKLDIGYRSGSTGRVQGLCIPLKWSLLLFSNCFQKLFISVISELRSSLVVQPLLRKILDLLLRYLFYHTWPGSSMFSYACHWLHVFKHVALGLYIFS